MANLPSTDRSQGRYRTSLGFAQEETARCCPSAVTAKSLRSGTGSAFAACRVSAPPWAWYVTKAEVSPVCVAAAGTAGGGGGGARRRRPPQAAEPRQKSARPAPGGGADAAAPRR